MLISPLPRYMAEMAAHFRMVSASRVMLGSMMSQPSTF